MSFETVKNGLIDFSGKTLGSSRHGKEFVVAVLDLGQGSLEFLDPGVTSVDFFVYDFRHVTEDVPLFGVFACEATNPEDEQKNDSDYGSGAHVLQEHAELKNKLLPGSCAYVHGVLLYEVSPDGEFLIESSPLVYLGRSKVLSCDEGLPVGESPVELGFLHGTDVLFA